MSETEQFLTFVLFRVIVLFIGCQKHISENKGMDAMELNRIESRFEEIKRDYREPQRTDELVLLMNVLESQYGTFKVWNDESDAPDMSTPEMRLYRQISMARWSE